MHCPFVPAQPAGLLGSRRDADLADVVQLGRPSDLLERLAVHAEPPGDARGQVGHRGGVLVELGLFGLHRPQQHLAGLEPRRRAAALVGVHPLVGDPQRLLGTVSLLGEEDDAE